MGGAVTSAATNAGLELGAKVAVLQGSPLAVDLYQRLGFREITRYKR